ncbi:MAG: hypothetical protein KGQ37_01055 [Hyphomicrobiales bacterium]|nr:hypothetical protein [Hyphomicrobiales bacterium]
MKRSRLMKPGLLPGGKLVVLAALASGFAGLATAVPASGPPAAALTTWPCPALRVPHLSVAAIWAGPPINGIKPEDWQNDPKVDRLVARLALRRTPLSEAKSAIDKLANEGGPKAQRRLLVLFAGLFDALNSERDQVIAGLDRLGRHQLTNAAAIRAAITRMHALQDVAKPDPVAVKKASDQLDWALRLYKEKKRAARYVCESPALIEHRLYQLGQMISGHLS